jgi:glycosyltransferase involved in cell wall biosynthesis
MRRLVKLLGTNYDIIHATIPSPFLSIFAAGLSIFRRKPLVVTIMSLPTSLGIVSVIYNTIVLPLILKKAAGVVVPTWSFAFSCDGRLALSHFKAKAVRIPFTVEPSLFFPVSRSEKNHSDGRENIIFVGVLDSEHWFKGLEYLLQSMKILVEEMKVKCVLTVVGDGDRRSHYEALTKEVGLDSAVSFRGAVQNRLLGALYRESAVAVLPSISNTESFGLVLAEAMACGVPVVASKIGGLTELVGGSGLLVPPRNPRALAEAISRVVRDKHLRANLIERGVARSLAFSPDRVSSSYQQLYHKVVSGGGNGIPEGQARA